MKSILAAGVLAGVGVAVVAQGGPSLRPDAPFVALAAGHVGRAYSDKVELAGASSGFKVVSGALPPGLVLDADGTVHGTPTAARASRLRVSAQSSSGALVDGRVDVSVFSADESEIHHGYSFEGAGPYGHSKRTETTSWTSSFDQKTRQATVLIYTPELKAGQCPLLVFHRGRGFGHDDYDDFLGRIASWGIVCASISDAESFYNPRDPNAADNDYDINRPELGMESASAAQEAELDYLLSLAADPSDELAGRIDPENAFFAGHSRGGGATHASHTRTAQLRARGVIYFMAFDLRDFNECVPPGTAPAYGIPTEQDRLPSLIIAAGNDGDLTYPIADEFIDRATGPTTFVTLYGGVHNFLGDTNDDEGGATITREDEQKRAASFVVAFIRRWANADITLEGFLYGDEHEGSADVGVASWRRVSPTLLVDDFQDAKGTKNLLGGANTTVNAHKTEESVYPAEGDFGTLGLKHAIVTFTKQPWSAFRLGFTARDVSGYRAVVARVLQTADTGWDLNLWGQLQDGSGQVATVKIASASADLGFLPPRSVKGDRFVEVFMPLDQFTKQNPKLDLTKINRFGFSFQTSGTDQRQVAVDDVRFE